MNLTAARNVIHYDLWWNPAVENQATDRVHRIGQDKDVMVYRLITKGTLEEAIDAISKRKSPLCWGLFLWKNFPPRCIAACKAGNTCCTEGS